MIEYTQNPDDIAFADLRQDLIDDDFHNGRTVAQLETSFRNTAVQVYAMDKGRCIGTARALSDGICNAYVVDVWTLTAYRNQGIATRMMNLIIEQCPGQHIYLFTDDAVDFYTKMGFVERPTGLEIVSGNWLQNQ